MTVTSVMTKEQFDIEVKKVAKKPLGEIKLVRDVVRENIGKLSSISYSDETELKTLQNKLKIIDSAMMSKLFD